MSRRYAQLTFTPRVKAQQEHYGVRTQATKMEEAAVQDMKFGDAERTFIEARDSFYVASVLENGWPYMNHRGGPPGFLRVLDDATLAYPDFRGNLQYITVGNMRGDGRMALFLMDYPNRRRLKIMARAEVVDAHERPGLLERVELPSYRARVERVVLLHVEAFDWNCPQHITPRFSEEDVREREAPLRSRIAELEESLAVLGGGPS